MQLGKLPWAEGDSEQGWGLAGAHWGQGLRWQRLCRVACVLIPFCHPVLGRCPSGALLGCHDMRLGLGSELEAGPVGKLPRVGEVLASLGLHIGLGDS